MIKTIPLNGKEPHNGRGERIRTSDIRLPKAALYQAEPRPDDILQKSRRTANAAKKARASFSIPAGNPDRQAMA